MSDFRATQYAFAAHLRDPERHPAPEGMSERGAEVYRELFFANISEFLSGSFPVVRSLHEDDDWEALVRDFYSRHHAESPIFADLPLEFVAFLQNDREGPGDPPFLAELAHYEWIEIRILYAADIDWAADLDADGDLYLGRPAVSPLAFRLDYVWPVHRIGRHNRPDTPPALATHLVCYRNRADEIGFLELSGATARLIDLLQDGRLTGKEACARIAEEIGGVAADALERLASASLENLRARDVLLGTHRTDPRAIDTPS